jgi:hypothetical protein
MTTASTNSLPPRPALRADLGNLCLESLIRRFRTSIHYPEQRIHFPKVLVLPRSARCSAVESTYLWPCREIRSVIQSP